MVDLLERLERGQVPAAQDASIGTDATSSPQLLELGRATSNSALVELSGRQSAGARIEAALGMGGDVVALEDVTADLCAAVGLAGVGNCGADGGGGGESGHELVDEHHGDIGDVNSVKGQAEGETGG